MNSTTYLKENSIKITKGRVHIIDIFMNFHDPMNADFIFAKCKEKGMEINLSTIYRNLEILDEKHLVEKFDLGDGRYNYKLKENKHTHIIECDLCHKEIEIDCPMIPIQEMIKNKTGFTMVEHELKIKGFCDACKKNKE